MKKLAYELSFGVTGAMVNRSCRLESSVDMTAQQHWVAIVNPMRSEQIND
ncbi:MAG: hypothetical protein H0V72_21440 [Bradyrhizobium sp.]|nr:hypothetical protein [Bradyrhizobium sp.]